MGKNEFSSKNDMNLKQQWEQVTMCKDSAYYDGVINIPDNYYINYVTITILTM